MVFVLLTIVVLEAVAIGYLLVRKRDEKKSMDHLIQYSARLVKKEVDMEDLALNVKDSRLLHMAKNINLIRKNFYGFVEATKGNVIVLSDAIEKLSDSAKTNEKVSEQISFNISSVATNTDKQLELVRDNLSLIESDNEQLGNIKKSIGEVQQLLNDSVVSCKNGVATMENYEQDMHNIERNLKTSASVLQEFNEQIEQINTIGALVIDVSEQLELLSLNASIEAARAGEAGKGFSVVSNEMSTMSEKTRENMDAINGILAEVIKSSEMVTESIQNCNTLFSHNAEIFGEVSSSFRRIDRQSKTVNKDMNNIADKYNMIARNSDISYEKAENVLDASESITESTNDMVSVSQQTVAESVVMRENVDALEKMLASIQNLVQQFQTGIQPVDKDRKEKVKIAFFSKLDNYFWYSIKRGVFFAKKELEDKNAEITYFPYVTMEDEKRIPKDIERCIDGRYDALVIPGFLNGIDEYLCRAIERGIEVFSYNCDVSPNVKRISCYVPNQEEAAMLAAEETARVLKKKGKVAVIAGPQNISVNKARYECFVKYMKEHYKDIEIADTIQVENDSQVMYDEMVAYLKRNKDVKVIYTSVSVQLEVAKAIEDCKADVKEIVFDQNEEIYKYIKKGIIAAAIDHSPFLQGHDPIIMLYNHFVDGDALDTKGIDCKANVINEENYKDHIMY